jgi:hypothetical protein
MPIKSTLTGKAEYYEITGVDESGLIPEGIIHAMVEYRDGNPFSIFYSKGVSPETRERWHKTKLTPELSKEIDSHYASEHDSEKIKQVIKILKGE